MKGWEYGGISISIGLCFVFLCLFMINSDKHELDKRVTILEAKVEILINEMREN